jgi:hypothetical protein
MSAREFDIIIKNKLEDSLHAPTEANWEALHAKINTITVPGSNDSNIVSAKTPVESIVKPNNKKWLYAAAILLPIFAIAYYATTQNNGSNNLATKTSAPTAQDQSLANTPDSVAKTYNTALPQNKQNMVAQNANSAQNNSPENIKNNFVKQSVAQANSRASYDTKKSHTNANPVFVKPAVYGHQMLPKQTYQLENESPSMVSNEAKSINAGMADVKVPNVKEVLQPAQVPNTLNPVSANLLFANNAIPNNSKNNLKQNKQFSLSLLAGYGASKGNASIKQAGVLLQQKLNERFYADASVQLSAQGEEIFAAGASAKNSSNNYNQDVNVLSGNYASTAEITDAQKQRAINRVPITQVLFNPSVGYNLGNKSYIAFGGELARPIETGSTSQLKSDLNNSIGIANAANSSNSRLGAWDGGITTKLGYRISNKLSAEAKYRKGLTNVVENLDGNTKRTYGLLSIIYRLR